MVRSAPYPFNTWPFRISAWLVLTTGLFKASTHWMEAGAQHGGDGPSPAHLLLDDGGDDWDFDASEPDPIIRSRRCDACRLVARTMDAAFELAEERLLTGVTSRVELDEVEVAAVVAHVCSRQRMAAAPMTWRGRPRLAARGLETWARRLRVSGEDSDVDWAQRVSNHCRFLSEKLEGAVVYDMWLRTSADQPEEVFESFLCYGEGVFGDCNEHIEEEEAWPAGDGREEDEDDLPQDGEGREEGDGAAFEAKTLGFAHNDGQPDFLNGLDEVIERVAEQAAKKVY